MSRDILEEMKGIAVHETAMFVLEHLPTCRAFDSPQSLRTFALAEALKVPGLICEFGVHSGYSINELAGQTERQVYGFDSFEGLPEAWRTGFPAGHFGDAKPPSTRSNVELIIGLFADTLPEFFRGKAARGSVALAHIDCDLYSSTLDILRVMGSHLQSGAVVVFDEFFNYPGWKNGEYRAWVEFVAASGAQFRYLGFVGSGEQVAVQMV